VFWTAFPVLWALNMALPVSVTAVLWGVADVMGKIVFSSSLLHGNLMSLEQRRHLAMRIVEEGNRCAAANLLSLLPGTLLNWKLRAGWSILG
jgi:hypothetical protein